MSVTLHPDDADLDAVLGEQLLQLLLSEGHGVVANVYLVVRPEVTQNIRVKCFNRLLLYLPPIFTELSSIIGNVSTISKI